MTSEEWDRHLYGQDISANKSAPKYDNRFSVFRFTQSEINCIREAVTKYSKQDNLNMLSLMSCYSIIGVVGEKQ